MIEYESDLHFSSDTSNQAGIMSEVFVYVLRKEIASDVHKCIGWVVVKCC